MKLNEVIYKNLKESETYGDPENDLNHDAGYLFDYDRVKEYLDNLKSILVYNSELGLDPCIDKTNEEEIVKVYFISKDNSKLNRELNDSINTFGWISDNYFVFSKETKGLYCFDLNTGDITTLISDKKKFEITSTGDAYIVYDGVEQRFEF